MRTLWIILISFGLGSIIQAQSPNDCNYQLPLQSAQWVFGKDLQLDFLEDPVGVNNESPFEIPIGASSISDANGALLFFTNGEKIWNKEMNLMYNGSGLHGNDFSTQSSVIIPQPGHSGTYIVFTVDLYYPTNSNHGINYSVVEVSSTFVGSVVEKNTPLMKENAAKIAALQHANGQDYWVIVHGLGPQKGGTFYCYLVDENGVSDTPVTTQIGHIHQGDEVPGGGFMKFSPDGSMLAIAVTFNGVVELYDFDAETGQLANLRSSADNQFVFPYGIEFSPDNALLYLTTSPLNLNTTYLYQFDLANTNPFEDPFVIDQFDVNYLMGADSAFGALQMGIDGRIYVAKSRTSQTPYKHMGIVYNPNRLQAASNYNHLNHADNGGLFTEAGGCQAGLPNFAANFLDIPHFYYLNQCDQDSTQFVIRNTANIDQAAWEFDNTSGEQVGMDPMGPVFVFSDPGSYQVSLKESYDGLDYEFDETVVIHPLPAVDIGLGNDTIYILPNSSIRLDAGEYDYYYWLPDGSTNRYYDVTEEGNYLVSVIDTNCCTNSDEVYVKYAKLNYPNAFRPSSTVSENQIFKIIGQTSALAKYRLQIYNRWGQLIFETEDPAEGWDGNHKGELAPHGTYVWVSVHESFESGKQGMVSIDTRGTVVLLR